MWGLLRGISLNVHKTVACDVAAKDDLCVFYGFGREPNAIKERPTYLRGSRISKVF